LTPKKIWAVYFSATGTTKKIVEHIASSAANEFDVSARVKPRTESYDFSKPRAREQFPAFAPDDLVVFGTPVYAGRVPNLLLKQLALLDGAGAAAIPVVLFGNRNFDDALIELRDILGKQGFAPFAAGAFAAEHAFSTTLGKGRPDERDMALAESFAKSAAKKLYGAASNSALTLIPVEGTPSPYRGYYQPRDRAGNPIDIRKVKPLTNENCTDCKKCAEICTMDSIGIDNVREVTGICTKCCACVKGCPVGAKYFADENFLYHQHELEAQYERRAEPSVFC
jgi:flavodoxin/NAD-dependent dihydropyrimidine dehydrogenase PreA subunit